MHLGGHAERGTRGGGGRQKEVRKGGGGRREREQTRTNH